MTAVTLIDVHELSAITGLDPDAIRHRVYRKRLRALKFHGRLYFPPSEVARLRRESRLERNGWITVTAASRKLGLALNSIRCAIRQGRIFGMKIGDTWRVDAADIAELADYMKRTGRLTTKGWRQHRERTHKGAA